MAQKETAIEPQANPNPVQPTTEPPVITPQVPPQPVATQPVTPPVMPQAPMVASMPTPPVSPTKSKGKGLIIGLVVGLVVLLIVGFLGYSMFLSPAAQAKKAANAYLTAATTGNKAELYKLDAATSDSDKKFDDGISDSMKGSYKLIESGSKDGKWFYLYQLTGAKSKRARAIVVKKDGKYVVDSIVIGADTVSLYPGTAASTPTSSDSSTDTQPTATTAAACLTQDDYKYMNFDKSPDTVIWATTLDLKYHNNKVNEMFFNPDSTTETSLPSVYDDWADFASKNASKQWTYRLEGSIRGTTADTNSDAGVKLAAARSQRVKDQLVQRGVPADRIVIDPPHDYSTEDQDSQVAEIYRRVQILVDPTCTSAK